MPKNDFLRKIQAQKELEIMRQRLFSFQWCADAAILAANDVFQRKGEKLVEFHKAFDEYAKMIAQMTLDDAKADKSIVYTKEKLDGRLKELLWDDFVPWEERYGFWK